MATFEEKTFTVTHKEWWVPAGDYDSGFGASWVEVNKAFRAAHQYLDTTYGDAPDDVIEVFPHDEHIVVRVRKSTRVEG
jgi:hypothetical protein